MTDDQYRQLVEFLGEQFAQVDRRFAQIDGRFTRVDARFVQLDEQIAGLAGDLEGFRSEVRTEFDETKGMIRFLDRRLERLEAR